MEKTIKARVSNTKPLTGNNFTGDKHPRLKTYIWFCKVEDSDKYDNGNEAVIHIKIYKSSEATKKNTKKPTFSVIKYFDCQGPKVICVINEMTVRVFEQLGITTWKDIDQSWIFFSRY